ncbi:sigma factor-like helix-turn-helix DNA-binding protein [Streptomyces sp. CMB-StM0423]|uniref:sigma factor-like helix-turn-helix DNA-binding protein n=1 Tax=Streptomyces sp. CMB-StM0423 TaxID=2059884 RepID=UPI003FA3B071
MVVLDRLTPPQRVAYVLHELSGMPFREAAETLGTTEANAKKHASRARARIRGTAPAPASAPAPATPPATAPAGTAVADAFLAAAAGGDRPHPHPPPTRNRARPATGNAATAVPRGGGRAGRVGVRCQAGP